MILLERESYLDSLRLALREAGSGNCRAVFVSGEAGIGKTSLVTRFTQEQHGKDGFLWGVCDPLFTSRPLSPLFDIARQAQPDLMDLMLADADWLAVATVFLKRLERGPSPTILESQGFLPVTSGPIIYALQR